jgi:hypothetical protein
MNITAGNTIVPLSTLNVYKQLDDETVATVNSNNMVMLWNIEDGEAHYIGGIGKGTSNLTIDALIARAWGK